MRTVMGMTLAAAILLGSAGESNAQFSLSIGNPYAAQGTYVGAPAYGYGTGYSGYPATGNYSTAYNGGYGLGYGASPATYGYNSAYSGYAGIGQVAYPNAYTNYYTTGYRTVPGTVVYNSGYRGYVAPVNPYGYRARPYYGNYGYGNYGYGSRDGFRPFMGRGGLFR